jgi:hypothetical protein
MASGPYIVRANATHLTAVSTFDADSRDDTEPVVDTQPTHAQSVPPKSMDLDDTTEQDSFVLPVPLVPNVCLHMDEDDIPTSPTDDMDDDETKNHSNLRFFVKILMAVHYKRITHSPRKKFTRRNTFSTTLAL